MRNLRLEYVFFPKWNPGTLPVRVMGVPETPPVAPSQAHTQAGFSFWRRPTMHRQIKRAPVSLPGLQGDFLMLKSKGSFPLDAPTLSRSTNHARATGAISKKCKLLFKK